MGCILTKVCSTDEDDGTLLMGDLKQQQQVAMLTTAMPKRLTRTATTLMTLDPIKQTKRHTQQTSGSVEDCIYYGGGIPGVALDEDALESPHYTGAVDGGYASANGRLRWGAHTRAGNDPLRRRKENQDSFCVADRLADEANATLFSVFDGHGPYGAHASHFVRDVYHEKLAGAYKDLIVQPKTEGAARRSSVGNDIMSELFQRASRQVVEALAATPPSSMDLSVSGTTAVAMLVCERDVFVSNIGDSRCVVAVYSKTEQKYTIRHETKDHKPDMAEERQRIEASNGRIFEWGTYRVWLQDVDMPGLAMSRSFGDTIASTIGVSAEPDVTYVDKVVHGEAAHPSFAVLASDGVWEFISSEECVAFIADCIDNSKMTPQEACNALIAEAHERWNKEEDVVDDITAIVVYF